MTNLYISKTEKFEIHIDDIASDKSISHRCAIFALLSDKPSYIKNYLQGEDTLNTLKIAKQLGLSVKELEDDVLELIPPKEGILEPDNILDCGNAGTAIRLYTGLLSGIKGYFVLSGDEYLRIRPMDRVIKPLSEIGAQIYARKQKSLAPISIIGKKLQNFNYMSPVSSAQVKSAMILAGLNANAPSKFNEPFLSRDHTENMLKGMGAEIINENNIIQINPLKKPLNPLKIDIPSDPSSAFFFAVAACIIEGSKVILKNVLLNKTRIEAFNILKKMGALIEYEIKNNDYENIGNIYIEQKPLKGVVVDKNISWLIDELPALSIAMACAKGRSEIKNAKELRVKECDRITAVVCNLNKMGIQAKEYIDGYCIDGGDLKTAKLNSFGDHRIAMSFAIAGIVCGAEIEDSDCIKVSFPNFLDILRKIAPVKEC